MSELKITQEKVTAAFSEANDCPKAISILTALFGKQKPDYTDYHNIKTYEDACEAIGVKPIVRLLVEDEDGHKEEVADIAHLAYIKLCTIARALNNDPNFPRFTKDETVIRRGFIFIIRKKLMEANRFVFYFQVFLTSFLSVENVYPISSHFPSSSSRISPLVLEVLCSSTMAPGWIRPRSFSKASSFEGCLS